MTGYLKSLYFINRLPGRITPSIASQKKDSGYGAVGREIGN